MSEQLSYCLIVQCGPEQSEGTQSALAFAAPAVAAGHQITQVFFYLDGVRCAQIGQSEPDVAALWTSASAAHQMPLLVCVGAAARRGLIDADQAARTGQDTATVAPGFDIVGLGQLVAGVTESDRVITFG